jgi:starch synthase
LQGRILNDRKVLQKFKKIIDADLMRIIHLAAEFAPIAKAGGLGEVVTGLAREETRAGETVEVIIPKYDFINIPNLQLEVPEFKCLQSGQLHSNAMWSATCEGCSLHLLEARHPAGYFHRGKIYGCEDDIPRFIYFTKAVLEYLSLKKEPIDVLHIHDWHVALAAPLLKDLFKHLPVKSVLLTIHNLEHQGKCATWDLDAINLNGASYLTPAKLQDNNPLYPQTINLLKGGIVYADAITTVSPTYAKEILTPAYGFGLDTTLRQNSKKITGILNGIDPNLWDPAKDPVLPKPYGKESSLSAILAAKEAARESLQKKLGLSPNKRPWIGAVTRLVPQKGPELIEAALSHTLERGGTFLLLGSSPIPKIQTHFQTLKEKYAGEKSAFLHFDYDEKLAHEIFAALDFLVVPSHFEPCGLTQIIAMRYGTLPIVRATGGLKDTVFDCEDSGIPAAKRNGFLFEKPTASAIHQTIDRAIALMHADPATFQSIIRKAIQIDSSWKAPSREYLQLYREIIKKPF